MTTPTRRITTTALAVATAAALTACTPSALALPGGLALGGGAPQDVAMTFLEDFNDGDMTSACGHVDVAGQFDGDVAFCEQNLHGLRGFWTVEDSSTWEIGDVDVTDPTNTRGARADVEIILEGGSGQDVELAQIDGSWLVIDLP